MKLPEPTPNWMEILNNSQKNTFELLHSEQVRNLIMKANVDYEHWEKFKYNKMPEGITPDEAWAMLKFTRYNYSKAVPVVDKKGNNFR